jgi:tetratricopeptide (TPR) repeat protein
MALIVRGWRLALVTLVAAAPAVAADDPDAEIARRHFERGLRFYGAFDYERALHEFEAARVVKALPNFEFNIARCHDRLEHLPEAIARYKSFIAATSDPYDAEEARARIKVLEARVQALAANAAATKRPPPPPAARPVDDKTEAARRIYQRGVESYGRARYAEALAAFEESARIRPAPALRFNTGRCHEQLGQWRAALVDYETYLAALPPTDEAELRARLPAVRERAAAESAQAERATAERRATPVAPTQPVPPARPRRRWWVWGAVAGAAVVALVGALTIGLLASGGGPPQSSLGNSVVPF